MDLSKEDWVTLILALAVLVLAESQLDRLLVG